MPEQEMTVAAAEARERVAKERWIDLRHQTGAAFQEWKREFARLEQLRDIEANEGQPDV